jgi:hypothetical protein
MPEDNRQPEKMGCAILFVPTLIVLDCVGVVLGPKIKNQRRARLVSGWFLAGSSAFL